MLASVVDPGSEISAHHAVHRPKEEDLCVHQGLEGALDLSVVVWIAGARNETAHPPLLQGRPAGPGGLRNAEIRMVNETGRGISLVDRTPRAAWSMLQEAADGGGRDLGCRRRRRHPGSRYSRR